MQYVVHVNLYTSYDKRSSRVHRSDCSFAKTPGVRGRYAYWHGYYQTIEDARTESLEREPYAFLECRRCLVRP